MSQLKWRGIGSRSSTRARDRGDGVQLGPRRSLQFKYTATTMVLVSVGLLVLGVSDVVATYRQAVDRVSQTQAAQVREVTAAVGGALAAIEKQVVLITALPWEVDGWLTLAQRKQEYRRLLRVAPAVEAVRYFDSGGVERVVVSKRDVDLLIEREEPFTKTSESGRDDHRCSFGAVVYRDGFDPLLPLIIEGLDHGGGRTVVEVGLRALAAELAPVLAVPDRTTYVADREGRVVLHRDPGLLVRQVRVERAEISPGAGVRQVAALRGRGLDGEEVLISSEPLAREGWRVYVEEPRAQVLQPVFEAVVRTGLVTVVWLVLVLLAALYLTRRLTQPVSVLASGAAALASGQLETRIEVTSNDELGDLAVQFNRMAESLRDTILQQEQRIADKTHDLEVANRHKSEFLAHMSHELRTPLQSVIGMSEALLEQPPFLGPLGPKQVEYANDIHASGGHLLGLINEILDMSKIESGHMSLDLEMVDVNEQIELARHFVAGRAESRGVVLLCEAPEPLIEWRLDRQRFLQIVLNLMANGVKFTPSGGTVSVNARVTDRRLVVEVNDTGRGIAPEHHAAVFESFRQVGKGDLPSTEGTGLGLALVRRLTELHGGSVTLDSEIGRGSRFTVVFPEGVA